MRDAPLMAVFGGLASLSYYLLWVQQESVGTGMLFAGHCFPMSKEGGPLPFRLPYTGYENIDIILCLMVSFFHPAVHQAPVWQYTLDLVGSLAVELVPFLLDASALFGNNRLAAVLFPLILGLVYSLKGGAVVLPAYWLLSMIVRSVQQSTGHLPHAPDTIVSQATAFAMAAGYLFPSMLMFLSPTPKHIALWVGFPVTIAAAQTIYYVGTALGVGYPIPLPYKLELSAYEITQLTYVALGAFSIITHLPLVFGIIFTPNPLQAAWAQLVPRMHLWNYESKEEFRRVGMLNEIQRFQQWDLILIALTTGLVGTWSWAFTSVALAARVVMISLVGCAILGPGAVVAAVFIVKEASEQNARIAFSAANAKQVPAMLGVIVETAQRAFYGRLSALA